MEEEKKKSNALIWIGVIVVAAILTIPALKLMKKANTTDLPLDEDDYSAFNAEEGELKRPRQAGEVTPPLLDVGLRVRYQTKKQEDSARQRREEQLAREREEARRQAANSDLRPVQKTSRREYDFLRRHDRTVRQYQEYLSSLGRKYYKRYPAVRQMDAEFASMGRFMALKQQYARDRDAYKWARSVMGLPEVRSAIIRYSANPQVLKAMVEVSLEALRHPPPKAVRDEMFNFFCEDRQGSKFLIDMTGEPMRNVTRNLNKVVTPDTDISPLEDLGQDLKDGIMARTRRYQQQAQQ